MEELITIVFPVYNVSKYVEKSLLSLLNQSYKKIEILIIDDCGTDESMNIICKMLVSHPRRNCVRIIRNNKNLGISRTRNVGLNHVKGEYVFFHDSDDILTFDCLEILYSALIKNNVDVVMGKACVFYEGESVSEALHPSLEIEYFKSENPIEDYFKGVFPVTMWNKLYRMEFISQYNIRCLDERIIDDDYFSYLISLNLRQYLIVNRVTHYYLSRVGSESNGNEWNERIFHDWTKVLDFMHLYLNKKHMDKKKKYLIKEKLFWKAVYLSERLLRNKKVLNKSFISKYLVYRGGYKNIFQSKTFLLSALLSYCPLFLKIKIIEFHSKRFL